MHDDGALLMKTSIMPDDFDIAVARIRVRPMIGFWVMPRFGLCKRLIIGD